MKNTALNSFNPFNLYIHRSRIIWFPLLWPLWPLRPMLAPGCPLWLSVLFLFCICVAHDLQLFEYSILSNPIILATSSDPTRLVINLIHRDSIHSPYYDKREDFTARLEHTMQIRRTLPTVDIQPDIHPSGFLFLVNFSIGQPPIPRLAIMDTGSSLLWVQCQPCRRCFKQYSPIYDSRSSSTYTILPCTSVYCIYLQPPTASCTSSDPCQYHQQYLNFVDSIGTLAKEQISFRTSDDGLAALHDVIFGCSSNNGDLQRFNKLMSGVFGLGFQHTSLATRLAKFSYCISNVSDPNYIHNKVVLGMEMGSKEIQQLWK
ncbi:hypothetical protein SCA6_011317 [Theobroma cacao]